jgi:alkaline phosphatase D
MTPSVTAVNFAEKVAEKVETVAGSHLAGRLAGLLMSKVMRAVVTGLNDDYAFIDSAHFGYSVIEFSRDDCTWDVYWVDKTVNAAETDALHAYSVRVPVDAYEIETRATEGWVDTHRRARDASRPTRPRRPQSDAPTARRERPSKPSQ